MPVDNKFSKSIVTIILCLWITNLYAQDFKKQYKIAKDLFDAGNYSSSMAAFKQLVVYDSQNPYVEYANYYYALSAYRIGYLTLAKDELLQFKKLYPEWQQINEVNYLLSKIYFDQREYFQGMVLANLVTDPLLREDVTNLKKTSIGKIQDIETIRMIFEEHPRDYVLADILAKKISSQQVQLQDKDFLEGLIRNFGLSKDDLNKYAPQGPALKNEYAVALVMPFLAETLEPSPVKKRNQFVLELYQGMKMAVDSLNQSTPVFKLLAYDNVRTAEGTKKLVSEEELKSVDLIVGPLFQEESKLILDFSSQHKIPTVISPLTNNSDFVKRGTQSFLFQPSDETIASKSAVVAANLARKKNCIVYYGETSKDSLMAATFIAKAKNLGVSVVKAERVRKDNSGIILKQLATATEYDEFRNPLQFSLKKDSIGSIYVASSNVLIYSKVINSVETRGDSILVIGREDWLDEASVDYSKYEQLSIALASPNHYSVTNPNFLSFRKKYMEKHGQLPSDYARIGYEFMFLMGKILSKYGKDFLSYFNPGDHIEGLMMSGYQFSINRDNENVPFSAVKKGELIRLPIN